MATITQTTESAATGLAGPRFELDIGGYLREHVFSSIWKMIFAVILILTNMLVIRAGFTAEPVGLSFDLAPNGQPTALGNLVLTLTNGALLTTSVVVLWGVGAVFVVYSAMRHHWPGPTQWLKESLYGGVFGALTTLFLTIIIVFSIRGLLSWSLFGAEFRAKPEQVALLREVTPGAIWGVVIANIRLFAVGRYPVEAIWRPWASLGLVLILSGLSVFAWSFGSPLKKFRKPLVWAWLISMFFIYWFLGGVSGQTSGPMMQVPTDRWGGFLLTAIITVFGIVLSFPIGVLLALGRRSESRGVPLLWLWAGILLIFYWLFGGYPDEPTTFNIPVLFRDPPIWVVTLSPAGYALIQAIIVIGACWAISYFLGGNLIKTFSVLFIELIRGVPFITILFMANVMIPIFLPRDLEIDNLIRVMVGVVIFTAAYLAEDVRGGLQAIPRGQYEAAAAIGLSTTQAMRLIILPQALRAVIPALVGGFIGLFKDTSLVAIVGLFDLLRIAQAVVSQPQWLALQTETYLFALFVFWFFSFLMSRASLRIERNLGVGQR
jgi:general L-amino acid transport system permease protein